MPLALAAPSQLGGTAGPAAAAGRLQDPFRWHVLPVQARPVPAQGQLETRAATTSTLRTPRVFDPIPTSTLAQQGAQADLVQDPLAGEGFGEHADHETEHGRAAVTSSTRCSGSSWIWAAAAHTK